MSNFFKTISAKNTASERGSRFTPTPSEPGRDTGPAISEIERPVLAEAAKALAEGQAAFYVDIYIDESKIKENQS